MRPAILGNVADIPVCRPVVGEEETALVMECLRDGWVSSLGPMIPRFEEAFAGLLGMEHGVACCNGTAALHLAFESLGIGPGDEVVVPAFTLIVSANTICFAGARPVLVDVEPDTGCIDPAKIEGAITPRTKAIVAVHMYGHPCDMDPILAVARRRGLLVVEDAAQAHGALYKGRLCGSMGNVGCFSFYANKIITTGEGGMVVTNDGAAADRARLLRNQAHAEERFIHHAVGFNYRMTSLQAAIGLGQIRRLGEKIERKRHIAAVYDELLRGDDRITRPVERSGCRSVFWMYGIVLSEPRASARATALHQHAPQWRNDHGLAKTPDRAALQARRGAVMAHMAEAGVETRPFFTPLNEQPIYDGRDPRWPDLRGIFPVSSHLGAAGFYLPSGEGLTQEQQAIVGEALKAALDGAAAR